MTQCTALDRKPADLALTVDYLLVCEDGSELGTPVDRPLIDVCKTVFEELQEDPLGPLEVMRIGGIDLPAPVDRNSQSFDLASELFDVVERGLGRMGPCLNRILLSREPECIPPHRVEHIVALGTTGPIQNIGCGVVLGVTSVKSRSGWVGKHVEQVELRFRRVFGDLEHAVLFPVALPFWFYG
ncbi:MAG: hypothetical protein BWY82_02661 [Verrucomicrobia bacterium ADurb.Bin474]|nr:MAG: hypothetical protein BWY82_02661 [Verrucomicrobia bacterium ADurb.Bin474]